MDDFHDEPTPSPGGVTAAARVAMVAREIDERCDAESEELLSDLLCAAWPGLASQLQ